MVIAIPFVFSTAAADDLGRVFTTPAERQHLDGTRTRIAGARDRPVVFQGIIWRKSGTAYAWIDGRAVEPGEQTSGFTLIDAGPDGAMIVRDSPTAAPDSGEMP